MNLKNYTSEVPASSSIDRIEKRIVDMGATSIAKQYDENKKLTGITFCFLVNGNTVAFAMPANIDKVFAVFWKGASHRANKDKLMQQAERTAWKNVAEWVEIQCSLIMMQQAEFLQVFMPYAIMPGTGRSMYQALQDSGMKLLQ